MTKYNPTSRYKLIYVYKIDDEKHKGILKVGKAQLDSSKSENELEPNCQELIIAAKKRIDEQNRTALNDYKIVYTELAVRHLKMKDGTDRQEDFEDYEIHKVLEDSGFTRIKYSDTGKKSEWFVATIENTFICDESSISNLFLIFSYICLFLICITELCMPAMLKVFVGAKQVMILS